MSNRVTAIQSNTVRLGNWQRLPFPSKLLLLGLMLTNGQNYLLAQTVCKYKLFVLKSWNVEWMYFGICFSSIFLLLRCWPLTPPAMWTPWWWSTGRCSMTTRRLSRTNCKWRLPTQSRVRALSTRVTARHTCSVTPVTRVRSTRTSWGDPGPLVSSGTSRTPPRGSSPTWSQCRRRAGTTPSNPRLRRETATRAVTAASRPRT